MGYNRARMKLETERYYQTILVRGLCTTVSLLLVSGSAMSGGYCREGSTGPGQPQNGTAAAAEGALPHPDPKCCCCCGGGEGGPPFGPQDLCCCRVLSSMVCIMCVGTLSMASIFCNHVLRRGRDAPPQSKIANCCGGGGGAPLLSFLTTAAAEGAPLPSPKSLLQLLRGG